MLNFCKNYQLLLSRVIDSLADSSLLQHTTTHNVSQIVSSLFFVSILCFEEFLDSLKLHHYKLASQSSSRPATQFWEVEEGINERGMDTDNKNKLILLVMIKSWPTKDNSYIN